MAQNLREFQQSISDRIKAGGGQARQISTLGVSIAGRNWLVDMADISEVLAPPAVAPVPRSKAWVRGVANVRGSLYCVADVARYLKLGAASGTPENRVLLVSERHAFNAALLVDRVLGLRDAREWRADQAGYRDGLDVLWHKLDVGNLLTQPDFLQIGA